ncbi:MAG: hypothetical protein IMY67_04090 [Bacteroidetes bacterium]|nr:hypothetical protein [Bacteroidota bacterium]
MSKILAENTNNSTQHSYPNYAKDEVSLVDLIRTVIKRKKIAYIVFSLIMFVTIIFIFFVPVSYTSDATISVGYLPNPLVSTASQDVSNSENTVLYIENPNDLFKRLQGMYKVKHVKRDGVNIIELSITGLSPQKTQKLLIKTIDDTLLKHELIFMSVFDKRKVHLKKLQNNYLELEKQIKIFDQQILLLKEGLFEQAVSLSIEKGKILSLLPGLSDEILNIGLSIEEPQSRKTMVLKYPTLQVQEKNPLRYMIVGFFVGLFLGVFSTFAYEFVVKIKSKLI